MKSSSISIFIIYIIISYLYGCISSKANTLSFTELKQKESDRLAFYTKFNDIYSAYTKVDIDSSGVFLRMTNSTLPKQVVFTAPKEYIISGCNIYKPLII